MKKECLKVKYSNIRRIVICLFLIVALFLIIGGVEIIKAADPVPVINPNEASIKTIQDEMNKAIVFGNSPDTFMKYSNNPNFKEAWNNLNDWNKKELLLTIDSEKDSGTKNKYLADFWKALGEDAKLKTDFLNAMKSKESGTEYKKIADFSNDILKGREKERDFVAKFVISNSGKLATRGFDGKGKFRNGNSLPTPEFKDFGKDFVKMNSDGSFNINGKNFNPKNTPIWAVGVIAINENGEGGVLSEIGNKFDKNGKYDASGGSYSVKDLSAGHVDQYGRVLSQFGTELGNINYDMNGVTITITTVNGKMGAEGITKFETESSKPVSYATKEGMSWIGVGNVLWTPPNGEKKSILNVDGNGKVVGGNMGGIVMNGNYRKSMEDYYNNNRADAKLPEGIDKSIAFIGGFKGEQKFSIFDGTNPSADAKNFIQLTRAVKGANEKLSINVNGISADITKYLGQRVELIRSANSKVSLYGYVNGKLQELSVTEPNGNINIPIPGGGQQVTSPSPTSTSDTRINLGKGLEEAPKPEGATGATKPSKTPVEKQTPEVSDKKTQAETQDDIIGELQGRGVGTPAETEKPPEVGKEDLLKTKPTLVEDTTKIIAKGGEENVGDTKAEDEPEEKPTAEKPSAQETPQEKSATVKSFNPLGDLKKSSGQSECASGTSSCCPSGNCKTGVEAITGFDNLPKAARDLVTTSGHSFMVTPTSIPKDAKIAYFYTGFNSDQGTSWCSACNKQYSNYLSQAQQNLEKGIVTIKIELDGSFMDRNGIRQNPGGGIPRLVMP